ncbi:biliverdin-producing heme oxygenase [Mesonia sediminis]|uniref:Biliverdin-producing heme oxygenase n=1 Tax=Mesonia sediminis TaxID=1703946 RepID=A0ABW5SD21_9FLAO
MITTRLKEETKELHQAVENENLAYKIINHTISAKEYLILLKQNYAAYSSVEKAILKYEEKYKPIKFELLLKDLKQANANIETLNSSFNLKNKDQSIGAQYVIKGSSLGGSFIAKQMLDCPKLKPFLPAYFFSTDKSAIKDWNKFTRFLKENEAALNHDEVIVGAKKSFEHFLEIFTIPQINQ